MEHITYPFQLRHAIFSELVFKRQPKVPDDIETQLKTLVRLHSGDLPEQIQVQLRLETIEDGPFAFAVELIAIFDVTAADDDVSRDLAQRFVKERAFYMLFPLLRQKISATAHSMGVRRFEVPMLTFQQFAIEDLDVESVTSEGVAAKETGR